MYSPSLELEPSSPFECRRALSEDVAGIGDAQLGSNASPRVEFLSSYSENGQLARSYSSSSFSDDPAPTVRDFIELRTENRMLRNLVHRFISTMPGLAAESGNVLLPNITPPSMSSSSASASASASASTSSSDLPGSLPSPASSLLIRPLHSPPDRQRYPNVKIWRAREKSEAGNATTITKHPHHKSFDPDSEPNTVFPFVEDEHGQIMPQYRLDELRRRASQLFNELLTFGWAVKSWGKISITPRVMSKANSNMNFQSFSCATSRRTGKFKLLSVPSILHGTKEFGAVSERVSLARRLTWRLRSLH
ncbi:hypothetical protein A0H81_07202 [Grifola frondosa]|uniref:Uncharacterized protein n=1 Tax=Grifola frondosa TaxID=5627 RepID=A0A1C7M9F0_GRIFR|nr:hypothetical protein A0H81_07202 [Grifola frondosa]